jgi:PrcB C-terminal
MKRRTLNVPALAFAALACGSAPSAPGAPGEVLAVVRLRPEPFSFSYTSGLTQPRQMLVRSATEWRQVWDAIWREHSPKPPLPEIDFAREMVVVAALGERPTGGYSVFIEAASAGPDGIALRIRSVSPASGCGVTLAQTQPVDVARIPRREGPATFAEQREIQDCR